MLDKLSVSKKIFVDGTFKSSPKKYFQLLNIIINWENVYTPVCHIVMKNKFESSYLTAFNSLKQIVQIRLKKTLNFSYIMADFEKALRNALKTSFSVNNANLVIEGCYFHFCKALWKKASKLGLRN